MIQSRTHSCNELCSKNIGERVVLVGWYENMRKVSKNLGFLILRDFYGTTQIVIETEDIMSVLDEVNKESTLRVEGVVRERSSKNTEIATGEIEVVPEGVTVLGNCTHNALPFEINYSTEADENLRLRYRYLDLRNPKVRDKIILRSRIVTELRQRMTELGFFEITTPILTCSSPEGARDYLVPSRIHHGKFYALPQAPQQFKQILMTSGFDRYFQIAPCFRDEDARADRSPGEFYQLDMEMAFATQDDVFSIIEQVLPPVFEKYGVYKTASKTPFVRIPYLEALEKYGSDKPDLRIDLTVQDATDCLSSCGFEPFKDNVVKAIVVDKFSATRKVIDKILNDVEVQTGNRAYWFNSSCGFEPFKDNVVKAIVVDKFSATRKVIDKILNDVEVQTGNRAYWFKLDESLEPVGGIAKFVADIKDKVIQALGLKAGDFVGLTAGKRLKAQKTAGVLRNMLGANCEAHMKKDCYEFCWIVDFPMYEIGEESGELEFCHNPFSMPQGGIAALENTEPLDILAYQYDLVCNGVELSSGAVRNHDPKIMVKAFGLVGLGEDDVKAKFPAMYSAFSYGAPPHAGIAPGVDRMVMLISGDDSIREIIPFPMNKNAVDVMMNAPAEVDVKQLDDVHIQIKAKPNE